MPKAKQKTGGDPKLNALKEGIGILHNHYLLGPIAKEVAFIFHSNLFEKERSNDPFHFAYMHDMPHDAAQVGPFQIYVYLNRQVSLTPNQWALLGATLVMMLCFSSIDAKQCSTAQKTAVRFIVAYDYVRRHLKFNESLDLCQAYEVLSSSLSFERIERVQALFEDPAHAPTLSSLLPIGSFFFSEPVRLPYQRQNYTDYEQLFARQLIACAQKTLSLKTQLTVQNASEQNPATKAKQWLMNHFPLFCAVIAPFKIIYNAQACASYQISYAAISFQHQTIWVNPLANLSDSQLRFVIAHEALHAGLSHFARGAMKDPFIWNLATDFVINCWLIEMQLGAPPDGIFYDPTLAHLSSEEIYDLLIADAKLRKSFKNMRNARQSDILDHDPNFNARFGTFENACREALLRGLDLHEDIAPKSRGLLPAGLVEEIRLLNQKPIDWRVKLAQWFQTHFPIAQKQQTYIRPSRRQSAAGDVILPSWRQPQRNQANHTFGVILDTSGSMSPSLLGKALGAIYSYANAQDVSEIRLICVDACAYDLNWVPITRLTQPFELKGRGGTVLQPAVNLLQNPNSHFPAKAPVLIITDSYFESTLTVPFEHAFLLPKGARLPIKTSAPTFFFEDD